MASALGPQSPPETRGRADPRPTARLWNLACSGSRRQSRAKLNEQMEIPLEKGPLVLRADGGIGESTGKAV